MSVQLFATRPLLEPLLDEIAARQEAVLRSGRYILGPEVEAFEAEFADELGARHCVGVANGTDALTIALRALGVGAGDEVVVPALTFYATAEAVVNAGATPVFCDVDEDTFTMTAATAEPAIGARTKALIPVHLYGNPAPMTELRGLAAAHGLRLLEDAAQAAGAKLHGEGGRCPGRCRHLQLLPLQEPRRLRRRRRDRHRRRRGGREAPASSVSMAPAAATCTPRSATTPASTSCRRRGCGSSCGTSRTGPRRAAAPPPPTRPAASARR